MRNLNFFVGASILAIVPAIAQAASAPAEADTSNAVGEIIVTANKRSESINKVPMSITALSAQQLTNLGVSDVQDLRKVIPSFSASPTRTGTPAFTLRGVGFIDFALGGSPTVSAYVDQVPLPYSAMTRFVAFDLERVEVLKGPQGTLFGQNSTGGAINFIAAKPTADLHAGVDLSYGRFNTAEVSTFVSGPISDTLRARIAVKTVQGDGWQKSLTRDDTLGEKNQLMGRLLLDWTPTDRLTIAVNLNGWRDRSETIAPQIYDVVNQNVAGCAASVLACVQPQVAKSPRATGQGPRVADWDPGFDYHRRDYQVQAAARIDYELNDDVKLTSISSYTHYKHSFYTDQDGTQFHALGAFDNGSIKAFSQELRAAAQLTDRLNIVVGGNYGKDNIKDTASPEPVGDSSSLNAVSPLFPIFSFGSTGNSKVRTLAAFGNVDFELTDKLKLHAGVRYTDVKTQFQGCNRDGGDGSLAGAFNAILAGLTGTFGSIKPGQCVTITVTPNPASPTGLSGTPGIVSQSLSENNVSFRIGADYSINNAMLIYANISQGYKAGSYPFISATAPVQYIPAKQEKLIAYEAGTKIGLLDRKVQFNAAAFYYDYSDKQILGRIPDPLGIFGALQALVNVPKSRLYGFEAQLQTQLIDGLTTNFGITYLNSKVTKTFRNFDPFGFAVDFNGQEYPYTPHWAATGDFQYERPLTASFNGFVGASFQYQSRSTGAFVDKAFLATVPSDAANAPGRKIPSDIFDIPGYTVYNAQFGISHPDSKWRVTGWIRNLTNKTYAVHVTQGTDTTFRYVGLPRTYGASVAFRF